MPAVYLADHSPSAQVHDSWVLIGIAGGGIGGLALAAALHRRGADVVVFEQQERVRDLGAGISLWPNALAALDSVGLGEMVRDLGQPLASGGLVSSAGHRGATFSTRGFTSAFGEPLRCVDRGELVTALAAILPEESLLVGQRVNGYRHVGRQVAIDTAGHEGHRLDALIGADGIGSKISVQLAGPLSWASSGYTAWRGLSQVQGPGDDDGSFWLCLHNGEEFGWMPLRNGRTYWFATAVHDRIGEGVTAGAYLREAFRQAPAPVVSLLEGTPEGAIVRNDILDRRRPRRWTDGALAVLGDAAHPMRPHLGQGGCQAIEDAAVLTRLLTMRTPTSPRYCVSTREDVAGGQRQSSSCHVDPVSRTRSDGERERSTSACGRCATGRWSSACTR